MKINFINIVWLNPQKTIMKLTQEQIKEIKDQQSQKKNAKTLIKGKGPFRKYGSAEAHVLYIFDDLVLLAQPNFPDRYAWLLSKAMLKDSAELPGAIFPLKGKKITKIHPGVLMALNDETISQ